MNRAAEHKMAGKTNVSKKTIVHIIGSLITFASLIFIIWKVMTFDVDFRTMLSPKYALLIFAEMWLFVIVVVLGCVNWKDVLSYFSKKTVGLKDSFPIYSKSNLGKYLPGNVGHYVSRQIFGVSLGVKHRQIAISSILEVFYSAFSALLLSVVLSWNKIFDVLHELFPNLNVVSSAAVLFISGAAALALFWAVFRKTKFFSDLMSLLQDKKFWFLLVRAILRNTVCFLINGAMLALFVRMNVPFDYSSVVVIVTASSLSWLIGFVTPGAPGGIGVRETVLLFMLSPYFPAEVVLTSSVMCRISMVLGDVLSFLLGLFVKRVCKPER